MFTKKGFQSKRNPQKYKNKSEWFHCKQIKLHTLSKLVYTFTFRYIPENKDFRKAKFSEVWTESLVDRNGKIIFRNSSSFTNA